MKYVIECNSAIGRRRNGQTDCSRSHLRGPIRDGTRVAGCGMLFQDDHSKIEEDDSSVTSQLTRAWSNLCP